MNQTMILSDAGEPGPDRGFTEPESRSPGVDRLAKHEIFQILGNPRRYQLCQILVDGEQSTFSLRELVDILTAWENDKSVDEISNAERNRVYASLKQVHLPNLRSAGIIEFDNRNNDVTVRDSIDQVKPFLESETDHRPPLGLVLLGLAGVGSVLGIGLYTGIVAAAGRGWQGLALYGIVALGVAGLYLTAKTWHTKTR